VLWDGIEELVPGIMVSGVIKTTEKSIPFTLAEVQYLCPVQEHSMKILREKLGTQSKHTIRGYYGQ